MLDYLTGWRRAVCLAVLGLLVLFTVADALFAVSMIGVIIYEW